MSVLEKEDKKYFISRGCPCLSTQETPVGPFKPVSCNKLHATDWLEAVALPKTYPRQEIVEVRFKNSRKDFFRVEEDIDLDAGDIVAVESSPGHDIGIVSLTGELVLLQLKKKRINPASADFRKVYRKAKYSDIEKWIAAVRLEDQTMHRSRNMASSLGLSMKISDVEFQGDRTKAIFYYTADERVDFRELIKVMADAFHVRIEMRQIGMRQEASRLGGIGTCGRELCCSTWLTQFRSVSTNAARTQQLSMNPQKLAGQCSKLKCCINYENDIYAELLKEFPGPAPELSTKKGKAVFQKMDILGKSMGYVYKDHPGQIIMIPVARVREIQAMNSKNQFPDDLQADQPVALPDTPVVRNENSGLEDSLTRFDSTSNPKRKRRKKRKNTNNQASNSK